MKALLDAHFPHAVAELLQVEGLDVDAVTARPDIASDTSDEQLLLIAHGEGRAVITNNTRDFRPLTAELVARGEGHSGLICVPSSRPRTRAAAPALAKAIEAVMRAEPQGIGNSERWI